MRFFRGIYLFQNLNDRALSLLVQNLMEKSYREGEEVFPQGEVGRAVFIVAEGRVRLSRKEESAGGEEIIADMHAGDFFGEMVLLDELPRSAKAVSMEHSRLFILYKSTFDSLIVDAPEVASKILHSLARLLSARLRRKAGGETAGRAGPSIQVT